MVFSELLKSRKFLGTLGMLNAHKHTIFTIVVSTSHFASTAIPRGDRCCFNARQNRSDEYKRVDLCYPVIPKVLLLICSEGDDESSSLFCLVLKFGEKNIESLA